MRTRAIIDLVQLDDKKLFEEISKGLNIIFENMNTIYQHSVELAKSDFSRGYRILNYIACEEAAKYLILLDLIRCDRLKKEFFSRQLKRFHEHLAKGIYFNYCDIKPAKFSDVFTWLEMKRKEYYLDGPINFDWIFINWIFQQREECFYVDFVKYDDNYNWISPQRYDENPILLKPPYQPNIIKLVTSFNKIGLSNPNSLELIAYKWRPILIDKDFLWVKLCEINIDTLKILKQNKLISKADKSDIKNIIELWLFPLYSIDLNLIKVNKNDLKAIQQNLLNHYNENI